MDAKRSNGQVMVINGNENLSVLRPLRKSGSQYAKQWRCKREVCVLFLNSVFRPRRN